MERVLFIMNPKSGRMKSKGMLFDIINTMSSNGCTVTVKITTRSGEATEFASDACESGMYDRIVCCGGDGTLNETIAGILSCGGKIPVGYIPSGSTNDYAKTLGMSSDMIEAAKIAVTGEKYPIDIGCINGTYFNYIASFGLFTSASYGASQTMKNMLGHFAYLLAGVKDLAHIKAVHCKIEADGKLHEGNYIFGAVANSTSIGGVVKLDEALVSLNDGVFEICLVKKPANPADLFKIAKGAISSDFSGDCFEFFKASKLKFELPEPMAWTLDGEKYVSERNVEIDILRSAVTIVV